MYYHSIHMLWYYHCGYYHSLLLRGFHFQWKKNTCHYGYYLNVAIPLQSSAFVTVCRILLDRCYVHDDVYGFRRFPMYTATCHALPMYTTTFKHAFWLFTTFHKNDCMLLILTLVHTIMSISVCHSFIQAYRLCIKLLGVVYILTIQLQVSKKFVCRVPISKYHIWFVLKHTYITCECINRSKKALEPR